MIAYTNNQRRNFAGAKEGFSLLELMIAIAIMGILAAVIGPNLMSYLGKAKIKTAQSDLRTFEQAITMYQLDNNQYPTTLKDLVKRPANMPNWQDGGYLKKKDIPNDPWSQKYQYKLTPGAEHPYELFSYGPKGKGSKESKIDVWKL